MLPKAIIAQHVKKMQSVGEIIVEVHRYKRAIKSDRSNLEKDMVWEKDYDKEVHLKSVVKGTVTEGVV
jgi:hypothetical protein